MDGASSGLQKDTCKDDQGCINSPKTFQVQQWFSIILWLCTLYLTFLHFSVSIFNIIFWFTECFNNFQYFFCDLPFRWHNYYWVNLKDRVKGINYIPVYSVHNPRSVTKMWDSRNHLCPSAAGWFGDHNLSSEDTHFLPIRWWEQAHLWLLLQP